jgi:hypothetical protein
MTLSGVWYTVGLNDAETVKRDVIDMNIVPGKHASSRNISDKRLLAAFYTYHHFFPISMKHSSVAFLTNRDLMEEREVAYVERYVACSPMLPNFSASVAE